MIQAPYPKLDEMMRMLGNAGKRLAEIGACEGAAGNISVCFTWQENLITRFPLSCEIELPQAVPELAGATFIVSGSGRRLGEIIEEPTANLACLVVNADGRTAIMHTGAECGFTRVTSEFNSHLAVHYDQMVASGSNFHAVIHAQPVHLTYLSHIERYQDEQYLSTHLLRWQPETIINLPEGIGVIPFCIPGSAALSEANVARLRKQRMTVWARHGMMVRSEKSLAYAVDLIEYAETAARYEYLNLTLGEASEGLRAEEIRAMCKAVGIRQDVY